MNAQDHLFIESKFEGLTKLMNAHFENVQDKQEYMNKKQDKANGRITTLEGEFHDRELFCVKAQAVKEHKNKYRGWKIALFIIAAAIMASLINEIGLLEFLNFVK